MPTLTRWFLKTAMLYLLSGFMLGGWLLFMVEQRHQGMVGVLQPVYWHLLLVGWLMQLIFGVAYWMFPSLSKDQPHGNVALGWLTYGTLNLGLLLRVIVEPWHSLRPHAEVGWLLVPAAVLQVVAGWAFVVNIWARIRGHQR